MVLLWGYETWQNHDDICNSYTNTDRLDICLWQMYGAFTGYIWHKVFAAVGTEHSAYMFLQAEVTIYGTEHYNPENDVLLRLETMSEKEVRVGSFDKVQSLHNFFP